LEWEKEREKLIKEVEDRRKFEVEKVTSYHPLLSADIRLLRSLGRSNHDFLMNCNYRKKRLYSLKTFKLFKNRAKTKDALSKERDLLAKEKEELRRKVDALETRPPQIIAGIYPSLGFAVLWFCIDIQCQDLQPNLHLPLPVPRPHLLVLPTPTKCTTTRSATTPTRSATTRSTTPTPTTTTRSTTTTAAWRWLFWLLSYPSW
jgi:hypothetical protein